MFARTKSCLNFKVQSIKENGWMTNSATKKTERKNLKFEIFPTEKKSPRFLGNKNGAIKIPHVLNKLTTVRHFSPYSTILC